MKTKAERKYLMHVAGSLLYPNCEVVYLPGESVFNMMNDTEKIDLFQQLQMQEMQMRQEGFLDIQVRLFQSVRYKG